MDDTHSSVKQHSIENSDKSIKNQQSELDRIDAINYLFHLMADAYPNQYLKAFPSEEDERRAKNVWCHALKHFPPKQIRVVAMMAIRSHDFLPSVGQVHRICCQQTFPIKDTLQAYHEACHSTEWDSVQAWSHPAIFLTAHKIGWLILHTEAKKDVFPKFEQYYKEIVQQLYQNGELQLPNLSQSKSTGIVEESQSHADKQQLELMKQQGIDPHSGKYAFEELKKHLI